MKKIQLFVLAFASFVVTSRAAAGFADAVISYDPGTGFVPGYTNASAAIGEPSRVTPGVYGGPVDPFDPPYLTSQIVSIGAGGSLTVEFKTPILNNPHKPFGIDFLIFGDSFFVITNDLDSNFNWIGMPATDGSLYGNNGDTRVSVSCDGKVFYVLNPALAPTVDGLYPTDGGGDFHRPVDPTLTQADFAGLTLEGIEALYNGSGGGTGYDISCAQDSCGRAVWLPEIRYIRVDVLNGDAEVAGFSAVFGSRGRDRCR